MNSWGHIKHSTKIGFCFIWDFCSCFCSPQEIESSSPEMENRLVQKKARTAPTNTSLLPPCKVCQEPAAGFHYGANTCEACKVHIVFDVNHFGPWPQKSAYSCLNEWGHYIIHAGAQGKLNEFFRVKNVLTHCQCAQPLCVYSRTRMITYIIYNIKDPVVPCRSLVDYKKTLRALVGLGRIALAAAVALPG